MRETPEQGVTHWLTLLKAGDHESAQPLWDHYFTKLVRLVRTRLPASAAIDEEGVAASAFRSFWLGAANGRFPRLEDRHDLWRLLVAIAGYKIADTLEKANTIGRGRQFERSHPSVLERVVGTEPTPELAAAIAEEFQRLLRELPDDQYRQIALWKMEGYTNKEIGQRLGCSLRTVTNRLDVIRKTLEQGSAK